MTMIRDMSPQAIVEIFRRNLTRHYFDMKGRVRRREFWSFLLCCFVIYVAAGIVEAIVERRVLTPFIGLILLLPIAGLGARRLQDTGRNGRLIWAYTLPAAVLELVSLIGAYGPYGMSGTLYLIFRLAALAWFLALIVFACLWAQAGMTGPNAYGPDPRAAALV
jgi:uncharacterized membrane protein YhaH (DUF805 family)